MSKPKPSRADFDKYMKKTGFPLWREAEKWVNHQSSRPTKREARLALNEIVYNYYPHRCMMPPELIEFLDWVAFDFGLKKTKQGDYK